MKILLFAASTRERSINRQLIRIAHQVAQNLGHEATLIDLKDFEMPFYNGDWESNHGLPPSTVHLKELIANSDALIIATPEYNGSFPALLKNTLDWASRAGGEEDGRAVFAEKQVILMAATPGSRGGPRVLAALSQQMEVLKTNVIAQVGIGEAANKLATGDTRSKIETAIAKLSDGSTG